MTPTPQPESPEPLKVVAYLTTDEEGSPAMLFFDQQEAGNYCDLDEQPKELVLKADFQVALQSALKDRDAEIERLKKDAERSADWCSEVRQDREMVASALQALLKDPLNPETTERAHLALGEHING